MNPIEDTTAFEFFNSVFLSEKRALVEEAARLGEIFFESAEEEDSNEAVLARLAVRIHFISEYERKNKDSHFLIDFEKERFICPGCLVHDSKEVLLRLLAATGSGSGEWHCASCGLHYSPLRYNPIPEPTV
jgi:hypothetical protein